MHIQVCCLHVVADGYTTRSPDHWGRSERVHSTGERCWELDGPTSPMGEMEDPKDFMTVLMFGLGLEGCMPGERLGDPRGQTAEAKAQRCPVVGAAAQGKVVEEGVWHSCCLPIPGPRSHSVFR